MEQIPEIRESELGITINRRYHGEFELSISYAGQYIRRYPLTTVTNTFLSCILANIPALGWWLFSKQARTKMVREAYADAITVFVERLKLDVADAIFGKEE